MKQIAFCVVVFAFMYVQPIHAQTGEATDVFAYYHAWYNDNIKDGEAWLHWKQNNHVPPGDVDSYYYPDFNIPYSSQDGATVNYHMSQLATAGVGVVLLSWWGQDSYSNYRAPLVLNKAQSNGLKVAFAIGYLANVSTCTATTMQRIADDIKYLNQTYSGYSAYYRIAQQTYSGRTSNPRPVIFIFASSKCTQAQWNTVLKKGDYPSIRGKSWNSIVLGHTNASSQISTHGWDGIYVYNACDPNLHVTFCKKANEVEKTLYSMPGQYRSIYVATAAPGKANPHKSCVQQRDNGSYYDKWWDSAQVSHSSWLAIITYNEFHEGTQIERVKPKADRSPDPTGTGQPYWDYSPSAKGKYISQSSNRSNDFITTRNEASNPIRCIYDNCCD